MSAFEVAEGRNIYLGGEGMPVLICSTPTIATHICAVLNGASGLAVEFIADEHMERESNWTPPVRGTAQGDTDA